MKKIGFIIGLAIAAALCANAQNKSDKMYDSFSNQEGVTNFTFTKNMTDAFNIDLGDNGDEQNVTGDLHQVRFMSYNPKKGSLKGADFTRKAIALLPAQYKKYEDNGDDPDTEIWLLGGKRKFSECHVFINNDQDDQMRFIVSFYGDFTVNDLEGLKKTGNNFSKED